MRSFAVIAGFAAVALAAPQYEPYPAHPVESSAAAEYPAYPAESSAAAYPAESSAPAYEPEHPEAPADCKDCEASTVTEVIHATSFVCPEPTSITYGHSTYIVTASTVLEIPEVTATYVPTPEETPAYPVETPSKPEDETPAKPETPAEGEHDDEDDHEDEGDHDDEDGHDDEDSHDDEEEHEVPAEHEEEYPAKPETPAEHEQEYPAAPETPAEHEQEYPAMPEETPAAGVPYPSSNGTVSHMPEATGYPSGTGAIPAASKPAEFTGAAGKVSVGFFAIVGAFVAFL